jgi:flagellar protein FlaF
MPSSSQNSNPYAQAAGAYGDHSQKHTPDQRDLEAHVLTKSANLMLDLQRDWAHADNEIIEEMLKYNRQIWMLFYDTAIENREGNRPNDLRSNIVNLANFVFKHSLDIMADPQKDKFNVLIDINRQIAAGLREGARNDAAGAEEPARAAQEKQDSEEESKPSSDTASFSA